MPTSPLHGARTLSVAVLAFAASVAIPCAGSAQAGLRRSLPATMSDAEFWQFFTSMSEPGGSFPSENFVSNEVDFQQVIPTLKRTTRPGGVYLGVGPEQNFTYITNLQPAMAVIFDIRRQNAMAHLMYKSVFELSPTRAGFVSRLFSRPVTNPTSQSATAEELFTSVVSAQPSDAAFSANLDTILSNLITRHHFALSADDQESIRRVYRTFYEAGPGINYSWRSSTNGPSSGGSTYATFAGLQSSTAFDSVNAAFLANEANYTRLREMHRKNLIVPVVGDFGGPSAIRSVGQYLKEHNATVMAFYCSNVEQYLWSPGDAAHRFYESVATLPLDSSSTFIRSVPRSGGAMALPVMLSSSSSLSGTMSGFSSGATYFSFVVVSDSAGMRVIRTTTTDSGGKPVTRTTIDSAGKSLVRDSLSRLAGVMPIPLRPSPVPVNVVRQIPQSSLTSGIASMMATVTAHQAGTLSYSAVIEMTKTTGWK